MKATIKCHKIQLRGILYGQHDMKTLLEYFIVYCSCMLVSIAQNETIYLDRPPEFLNEANSPYKDFCELCNMTIDRLCSEMNCEYHALYMLQHKCSVCVSQLF